MSYCFTQHNSLVHISVSNFPSKCLGKNVPWLSLVWSSSSFLFFFRGARCIPRTAASPSGRSASARWEMQPTGGDFCFPASHYISTCLCNERNRLGSGIGTNAAQRYLPSSKWGLPPELQKDLATGGSQSFPPPAERGRMGFPERSCPRVLCGKSSSKARIRYQV